jgi:peroxiredoxin
MDWPSAPAGRGIAFAQLLAGGLGLSVLLFVGLAAQATVQASTEHRLRTIPPDTKPTFALTALDGATHDLQQQAGRLVLVHFFATWCEPCRQELSSLSDLTRQPGLEQVSILAINVAEVPARVRRFLESTPVTFPVLLDSDRAVTKAWGVHALPTTYVLDRNLVPRLVVEADLDWTKEDVVAALGRVVDDANIDLQRINREDSK